MFSFLNLLSPVSITSSVVGLKICAITAGIKKYKSIIRKNKKKHDKIVLLAKTKLNNIEFLISKGLINSSISHEQLISVNNVAKILKILWNILYKYGWYKQKDFEQNGVETYCDGILWLNEKHMKEGLDHKYLQMTTIKYL